MEPNEKVDTSPQVLRHLSPELMVELDGTQPERWVGEAIRLSTVGVDGWPHAAQLSVGEVVAVSPTELRVAMWPGSRTTANLRRDGKLTLGLVFRGAVMEIRGHAALLQEHVTSLGLAVFRVSIVQVQEHRADYADVLSGLTFRLHDPEAALARWREQIEAMTQLV